MSTDRVLQLMDLWGKIAIYMSIEDLGAMEIASRRFYKLYASEGYLERRSDESVSYRTYKTQYSKNGEPLTDKQLCVDIAKGGSSFVVLGGGFGSEEQLGYVFDVKPANLFVEDSRTVFADVIKHKQTFSERRRTGCSAAVSQAFGRDQGDHGLQMLGGFLEKAFEGMATESAVERAYSGFSRLLVPLPKKLSYAAATTMKDGSVLVTGGGAGPYRGSSVYKECYLKTVDKQREFEVDIIGQDDLHAREIPFMCKWQRYLGHHMHLLSDSSLSHETQAQLAASNLYPLHHSLSMAITISTMGAFDSDDSSDAGGGEWLNEILMGAIDESQLDELNFNDGNDGEDYFTEFGLAPIEALEHNMKKVLDVVWGRDPGGSAVPDMLHERCGHSLVTTFDDHALAMGGYGGDTVYHNSVEALDIERGWGLLTPMRDVRSGFASAVGLGGRVLVAGGSVNGEQPLAAAEAFDPREGKWSTLAPMNTKRGYCAGTMGPSGRFLVSGGMMNAVFGLDNSLEIYDQRLDKWLKLDPPEVGENEEGFHTECFKRTCHHMAYLQPAR